MKTTRNGRDRGLASDAELLHFLVQTLRPEIRAEIANTVRMKLAALEGLLIQLEQAAATAPESTGKQAIIRDISAAQTLASSIRKSLKSEQA